MVKNPHVGVFAWQEVTTARAVWPPCRSPTVVKIQTTRIIVISTSPPAAVLGSEDSDYNVVYISSHILSSTSRPECETALKKEKLSLGRNSN